MRITTKVTRFPVFPVHGAGFMWRLVRMTGASTTSTLALTLTLRLTTGLTASAVSAAATVGIILISATVTRPPVATSRPPASASTESAKGRYYLLDRYVLSVDRKYRLIPIDGSGGIRYRRLGFIQ